MKRMISVLLALFLCITVAPTIALPTAEAADVSINSTNFPDATFRKYVKDNFDSDSNGKLSASEIANATMIYVSETGVASLKGVEFLTALEELYCWDCKLTSLDVSKNTKLVELEFWNNKVTEIDVSGCPELISLGCGDNQITNVDVSKNPKLFFLTCQNNKLSSLDLSNNPGLGQLVCYGNNISSLNITPCPLLIQVYKEPEEVTDEGTRIHYEGWSDEALEGWIQLYVDKTTTVLTDAVVIVSPAITTQPKSQTAAPDTTVKFTVAATGGGLSYQWYYRTSSTGTWAKSSLTGNQTATLSVKATESRNGYQYRCKVSNSAGYKYSSAATLTVAAKPTVTTQPKSKTAAEGTTVKFTVKASGSNLKYQWYYRTSSTGNWNKSSGTGATTATLSVEAKSYRDGYQYRCKVSNGAGYVYSKAATLTVCVKPKVTTQPADKSVSAGTTVKFTVKATGGDLSYQWYYRTSSDAAWRMCTGTGATTATLTVEAKSYRNGYQYHCKITNVAWSTYSGIATLTVK